MRRRSVLGGLAIGAASGGVSDARAATTSRRLQAKATPVLDSLAMPVSAAENRQYSYTDKLSGYFYARTHADNNPDWFNGWNIATKRIFHDYQLGVDGVMLSRSAARAVISPHQLTRRFGHATETLSLLDGLAVLVLQVTNVTGRQIGVSLVGDLTDSGTLAPEGVWFAPKEAAGSVLLVAPIARVAIELAAQGRVTASKAAGGFFFIHAASKAEATRLLARVRRNWRALLTARAQRMEALVSGNHALDAGDPDRTKALLWIRLTGDQLVTRQLGTGIYAGLPWFNDYWGRDTFISITGLLFVNGQYEEAARVFESFAALQDVDPNSKTYGRVPNRARPDGIQYNSADGTPRFIITLADLVFHSGQNAIAKRLWPVVKRAIDGLLANNIDQNGLVTHNDADTWMDAKEKGVRAWSPRGNRAVDVQTLWLDALSAAKYLHIDVSEQPNGESTELLDQAWQSNVDKAAEKLSKAMILFEKPGDGQLVDHLRPDGSQDLSVRPNVLFSIGYREAKARRTFAQLERDMTQVRDLWQSLVYPWGVATLSQDDPNFHPYHEHWHYYHKDAAYHNGTVWPWLNGIAIQKMIQFNQIDLAWRLFENMNRQALHEGAVGSLAECADAIPVDGAAWSRRTGTFLQAWSNAEQLRVWQQCFLGFFAVMGSRANMVTFRSRLPDGVANVKCSFPVSTGQVDGHFHIGGQKRWRFAWRGPESIYVALDALVEHEISDSALLESGWTVEFEVKNGRLSTQIYNANGVLLEGEGGFISPRPETNAATRLDPDSIPTASQRRALENRIFAGLDFCKPRLQPNLKSLSVYHDPPLTY